MGRIGFLARLFARQEKMIDPRISPIYRYSKRRYLEELAEFGRVRFAHAGTFRDTTLTAAQYDDEHHRFYSLDPSSHVVDIYGVDGKTYHFENLPRSEERRVGKECRS